jgi:S1-C subfamily serine protease
MIQAVVVVNGTRYPVPQQGLRIGRAPENDVVLPDPNVSRQHLVVWSTPRGAFLRDLGSQNGTYLGERRVGAGPEAIPTGARVRIGVTDLQIEIREAVDTGGTPVAGGYAGGQAAGLAGGNQGPGGPAAGPYAGERRQPYGAPQSGSGAAAPYGGPAPYGGGGPAAPYARQPGRPAGGGNKTGLVVGIIIAVLIVAMVGTGTLVLRAVADSRATPTPTVRPVAATATTAPTAASKPVAAVATATTAPKPTEPAAKPAVPTATPAPAKPTPPPDPKPAGGRDPAFVRALNAAVRVIVPTGPSSASTGSGSIFTARGHILTNYHVVSDDNGKLIGQGNTIIIAVPPNEGDPAQPKYRARVAEVDTKLDLAVIQLTALENGSALPSNLGLNPIPIGSSKSVNIGDTIIIIGFPGLGGSSLTVTRGIHSGIARFTDDPGSFIKTDTEINRGNSGGTAINAAGELIGIPTAGRFDREAPGKIGLVRPIDEARPLLDKFTR